MSDCYKCQFRHGVPGSAHSSCHGLRELAKDPNDPNVITVETLLATGKMKMEVNGQPVIKIDPHGKAKGWAMWPFDFDPIWLSECQLFKEKSE